MPKTHSQYGKQGGGPCPPGYVLRHVEGFWVCVAEDGEEIPLNSSAPKDAIINPCPEGYELIQGSNGGWVCRNRSNGVTVIPSVAKGRPRISNPSSDPSTPPPPPNA